ncbi:MAG TPA: polysaccharide biosynthesis/export family protein [Woeseiaceae bacterium]|nr:polysaccharide biosynthesis/export family protein [Woeseiaceae bacterium]
MSLTAISINMRCALAGAILVLIMPQVLAQQVDIEKMLEQQQQQLQRSQIQREIGQLGQQPQVQPLTPLNLPTELRTDLPPMTDQGSDAAELLGTVYKPGDEAMFGEQLFQPGVTQTYGVGFNESYVLAIGDRIALRMWGAYPYQDVQVVDSQGNVFLPNVGPVRLAGVRNEDLNDVIGAAIREVYRTNVNVYASLEASKPVRVFVTGFVRAPGQYAGVASDSVLGFLLRAGGVDSARGSYIDIRLLRDGKVRAKFNLYNFLLNGRLEQVPIQDGDTIVVNGRHNAVRVSGDVFNSYGFEFEGPQISAKELLQVAQPRPGATHVSVVHIVGTRQFSEYYPVDQLDAVFLRAGDQLSIVSDRRVSTILVRVDGAIDSSRVLTLPYGSTLEDALDEVTAKPEANTEAIQLFRPAVAERQRQMLEVSLKALEAHALTSRSMTSEEADLRAEEAAGIVRFIDRARKVEPRGQIVLAGRESVMRTLLEDGDILVVPERSSIVMVHGEVTYPTAIAYDSRSTVEDYVALAGGTTQRKADARILLLHQDGTFVESKRAKPQPGDEILVLPHIGAKDLEVVRGISQILFQIAVVARVALDL